jgi:hypothetical protein
MSRKIKAPREKLKIPLDFKQTVMAALETKPERRKKKRGKRPPRS